MAPHSITLAWKTPWMEEPGGLPSLGSRRVRHDWVTSLSLFTFMHWRRKWQPTPVFLPGESQGWGPGGLPSMGSHRVRHNWSDLAYSHHEGCFVICLMNSWWSLSKTNLKTYPDVYAMLLLFILYNFLLIALILYNHHETLHESEGVSYSVMSKSLQPHGP